MLDWMIVGGGVHGTYLSYYLVRVKGVPREALRVLDPFDEPMARWSARAANTGMAYLRSPHAHNMDHDPWSIVTFAGTSAGKPLASYIPLHNRPSTPLFAAHTRWLIARHALDQLRIVGRADRLERIDGGWRVSYGAQGVAARHVVLALGSDDHTYWPDWALRLREGGAPIDHIFAPSFDRAALPDWSHLAVVGGGITAAQTALALAERHPGSITLVMRHAPRIHHFDSELGWIKGPLLAEFQQVADVDRRAEMIREARHRGSMPPDVYDALQAAIRGGLLAVVQSEIVDAKQDEQAIRLNLSDGQSLNIDRVVLATGFERNRPGGAWIDRAIDAYKLPVAANGFPIVDTRLCWADGLYVSGPLADLEIGPVARNLIGARLAAERIASVVALHAPSARAR